MQGADGADGENHRRLARGNAPTGALHKLSTQFPLHPRALCFFSTAVYTRRSRRKPRRLVFGGEHEMNRRSIPRTGALAFALQAAISSAADDRPAPGGDALDSDLARQFLHGRKP
jgi:hypothetical protein